MTRSGRRDAQSGRARPGSVPGVRGLEEQQREPRVTATATWAGNSAALYGTRRSSVLRRGHSDRTPPGSGGGLPHDVAIAAASARGRGRQAGAEGVADKGLVAADGELHAVSVEGEIDQPPRRPRPVQGPGSKPIAREKERPASRGPTRSSQSPRPRPRPREPEDRRDWMHPGQQRRIATPWQGREVLPG
jgi:hypothetical protein